MEIATRASDLGAQVEVGGIFGDRALARGPQAVRKIRPGRLARRRVLLVVGAVVVSFGIAFAAGMATRTQTARPERLAPVAGRPRAQVAVIGVAPIQGIQSLRLPATPRAHPRPAPPPAKTSTTAPTVASPTPTAPRVHRAAPRVRAPEPSSPAPAPSAPAPAPSAPAPAPAPSSPAPAPSAPAPSPSPAGGTGTVSGGGGGPTGGSGTTNGGG